MICFFLVRWNALKRLLDQDSILRESLNQPRGVVISHYGDFISQLQTLDGFTRGPMHLVAKRIETAAPIYEKQDGQRQAVLTEIADRLFGSVFINLKVIPGESTDDSRSLLFEHQRIDGHQINVDLEDFLWRAVLARTSVTR